MNIKRADCKFCLVKDLVWTEIDSKWVLLDQQNNKHQCDLDALIRVKIAEHELRHPAFDAQRFIEWLPSYLARENEDASLRIKKYVAYKAKIGDLNKKRRVELSIERYASLEHT